MFPPESCTKTKTRHQQILTNQTTSFSVLLCCIVGQTQIFWAMLNTVLEYQFKCYFHQHVLRVAFYGFWCMCGSHDSQIVFIGKSFRKRVLNASLPVEPPYKGGSCTLASSCADWSTWIGRKAQESLIFSMFFHGSAIGPPLLHHFFRHQPALLLPTLPPSLLLTSPPTSPMVGKIGFDVARPHDKNTFRW